MLRLSILGDSISTYPGVSNDWTANETIGGNPCRYRRDFPLEKTYWMRLIETFDMRLCVNNSWSGGNLSGINDPSSGVNRAQQLSRDDGEHPDVILVFMGINDLGRGVDASVFSADYKKTLDILQKKYPTAVVCCVNIPDRDKRLKTRAEALNHAIDTVVAEMGENFFVADLFHSRLNNEVYINNTVDMLHPDEDGMKIIADIIEEAIRSSGLIS